MSVRLQHVRVPEGQFYRLKPKAVKVVLYLPHNVRTSGRRTHCGLRCVAAESPGNVVEGREGKKKRAGGLLHLRSLDVLICFSNKAALWGRVLLIWSTHTATNRFGQMHECWIVVFRCFGTVWPISAASPTTFFKFDTFVSVSFSATQGHTFWANILISWFQWVSAGRFDCFPFEASVCIWSWKTLNQVRVCVTPLCWKKCAQPGSYQKVLVFNPSCLTRRPTAGRSTDWLQPAELSNLEIIKALFQQFLLNVGAALNNLVSLFCVFFWSRMSVSLSMCVILYLISGWGNVYTGYLKGRNSFSTKACKERAWLPWALCVS